MTRIVTIFGVITSYSIHYTKLYESRCLWAANARAEISLFIGVLRRFRQSE